MMRSGVKFSLLYAKGITKDLEKIPKADKQKIKESIEHLVDFPQVSSIKHLDNHPLADFRLRVGNYRVLFDVDFTQEKILILKIGHRKDIY